MAYRRGQYDFVVDSSFQPFTMQEMLTPFVAYKDAYEQSEAAYTDLSDKSDQFAYLSKTLPEGSRAREIYEGYANDLKAQAEDLARNGLTMGNRRALTSLKRRYQGEIGTLVQAKQAMDEEKKLRKAKYAQDPSMIYADDILSIDKFLEGSEPNLYGISGNDLYAKGAAAGKAYSSRIFGTQDAGSILNGYYIDYVQRMGYDPASLNQFQKEMLSKGFTEQISTLPELQQAAQSILEANGVTDNLTGNNLRRAQQQVIRGIIDGSVYTEAHNPQRDLGKMTASEEAADARAKEAATRAQQQLELSALQSGYKRENGKWVLDEEGIKKRAEMMGINSYNPDEWEVGPDGKVRRKTGGSSSENQKREKQTIKIRNAKTLTDIDKAGYVPVFATVHPSRGSSSGLSLEEAIKQKKYGNIEGWRSGPQGTDVPDLYIDWTGAPLVRGSNAWLPDIFQFSSGTSLNPNNGDFAYGEKDLKGKQVKILSDQEYAKLSPAIQTSIAEELRRQGYEDGIEFQVMEVVGNKGKRSYMTMVKKEDQILQGE